MRQSAHRTLDLMCGIPLLLMGASGVAIDVLTSIGVALNHNPNIIIVSTFPFGTIQGYPFCWLGWHFVFRTPFPLAIVKRVAGSQVPEPSPNPSLV